MQSTATAPTTTDLLTNTNRHLRDVMGATREYMHSLQPSRAGTALRSPQGRAALWKQLLSLPAEERQSAIMDIADKAGHQAGEQPMCELCKFLAEQVAKKANAGPEAPV